MSKKNRTKRGFTLTEMLVAIACAAILMLGITSAFVFLTNTGNSAFHSGDKISQLPRVREYIIKNYDFEKEAELQVIGVDPKTGDLKNGERIVLSNTGIDTVEFTLKKDTSSSPAIEYVICTLKSGEYKYTFSFDVDEQKSAQTSETTEVKN